MTSWLYREMIRNVNDPRLQSIRQINQAGNVGVGAGLIVIGAGCATANPIIVIGGGGAAVGGGVLFEIGRRQFAKLVGDHMVWDFKHKIKVDLGEGITLAGETDLEYSVPGNIHFGFVAGEAAYAATVVHLGADQAEITDPAHDPERAAEAGVEYVGPYEPSGKFGWSWDSGFSVMLGDDPLDHAAVNFGLMLYYKYGRNPSQAAFEQELAGALATFARHAPSSNPVSEQVSRDWPYPIGYFDPTRP